SSGSDPEFIRETISFWDGVAGAGAEPCGAGVGLAAADSVARIETPNSATAPTIVRPTTPATLQAWFAIARRTRNQILHNGLMVYRGKQLAAGGLWITRGNPDVTPTDWGQPQLYRVCPED